MGDLGGLNAAHRLSWRAGGERMPSFDVVNKVDKAEVQNAFQQATKELTQRYDFKGTDTEVERTEQGFVIKSSTEGRIEAAYEVLQEKLAKRKVSLKNLDPQKIEPGPKSSYKQAILLKEGIAIEKAREIVQKIKSAKLKVQAQIMDDQVRVSGKNRDDLQTVIQELRQMDLGVDLQFINMRD
jgi:uncharacterized protein YajQ (UPF0234 family)